MKQSELLDQFIVEARECLEGIGQRLLQVEKHPDDADIINDLFRLVHTLKGNCGLFSFKPLENVVHACEDLLDRVRSQTLGYSMPMADALLDAMDFTAQMVDEIASSGEIDAASQGRSAELSGVLRSFLDASKQSTAEPVDPKIGSSLQPVAAWHTRITDAWLHKHPQGTALRYVPESQSFFKGEDPWNLVLNAPGLVELSVLPKQAWPALETLDCYECNLDMVLISNAPVAYLEEHFRYVPEQIALVSLADVRLSRQTLADVQHTIPPESRLQNTIPNLVNRRIGQLWLEQQQVLSRTEVNPGICISVRRTLRNLLKASDWTEAGTWASQLEQIEANCSVNTLLAWTESVYKHIETISPTDNADASRKSDEHHQGSTQKILKVGQEKVDRLMDLIGEMVVAKNSLPYLAQRAEQVFHQRELAREIKAQYAIINRIADEMQNAIMQVRMMPVGTVFQRFVRLVRDISKRLGKEVELEIHGEDTEADKNVIESLADPLIHILRNSLDHGIELPSVRLAAGKKAKGTIRVNARQESDRVLIEIVDDGAGVNPERVRQVAVQRGLIPADKATTLSDADAVQLIFLPGFSTTEKISDLSGRGVGMDVVRTAVERINGSVTLSSVAGVGTTITLSLPLSMAVTNVMIVEVDGRRFGVPMDMIIETVRVHTEDIHHFKQCSTTVLRGKVVPLRSLHDLLSLGAQATVNEDGEVALLLVRSLGEPVGILVDQFHGATDIILKPLEGVLAGLTGFAGTALMGDGSVLMILHPKELL